MFVKNIPHGSEGDSHSLNYVSNSAATSSMNVFTDATYVSVITDGLPERASSLMFDLPSLKRLNRWKTVAFFISLVCWALCIVLYVSVAEYPKLKQNFTAARDSLFSGSTLTDVMCEQCASLKCTLNALYTSHDVRSNVKKIIWRHVNSRQCFAEFRKKTRVKVELGDTYISFKFGLLRVTLGGDYKYS